MQCLRCVKVFIQKTSFIMESSTHIIENLHDVNVLWDIVILIDLRYRFLKTNISSALLSCAY